MVLVSELSRHKTRILQVSSTQERRILEFGSVSAEDRDQHSHVSLRGGLQGPVYRSRHYLLRILIVMRRFKAQTAYCSVIGLGLGVWKIDNIQTIAMMEVYEKVPWSNLMMHVHAISRF